MALQTNVLREGEWVTETLNINDVLKRNSAAQGPKKTRLLKPPRCGILTKTVVESPFVNSVIPVRLRTDLHNDVAFIFNNSIHIKEFCEPPNDGNFMEGDFREGHLRDVVEKNDFGSRIRNACVLGSLPDDIIKNNDAVQPPSPSYEVTQLPPQLLVLSLECGDTVFLFVRPASDGSFECVTSRFPSPLLHRLVYPGFHMAIDPSSRYMALACAENIFVVHELESGRALNQRYMREEPLNPVRSFRVRSLYGTIHKVEFLHPPQHDDNLFILLLLIIIDGESKMVIYDWTLGDDLGFALGQEKPGHRLPEENKLPTLLVPLKTQSAFIMISENHIGVCRQAMQGSPDFESCELQSPPPTANHHGNLRPLWTAWARPFRYSTHDDCIYLVREDGHIAFLEADSDGAISNSIIMSHRLDCHTSGAVACLLGRSSEILVVGGSYGPGAIYRVPPRQPITVLGTLPNWAPTVDYVTTDTFITWNQETDMHGNPMVPWHESQLQRPDRIFTTSGRGKKGSITEFRYGLAARIGIELDYGEISRQIWAIPTPDGFHLVIALPGRSSVLQLSSDLTSAAELELAEETVQYDLTARTMALDRVTDDVWVQVTEKWVVLTSPKAGSTRRFSLDEILPNVLPTAATVLQGTVAIATYKDGIYQIYILSLGEGSHYVLSIQRTIDIEGEVTCLSLDPEHGLVAAFLKNGRPYLARSSLADGATDLETIDLETSSGAVTATSSSMLESVASIVTTADLIVLGTRGGFVVSISGGQSGSPSIEPRRFGFTTAIVSPAGNLSNNGSGVLVACDGNLVLLTTSPVRGAHASILGTRAQIWPADDQNIGAAVTVDHALPFPFPLAIDNHDSTRLLIVSGSRILFTEVQRTPRPVNRQLPVDSTPQRIVYSHHLRCLIVAASRNNRPILLFIDPDTGAERGRPSRKTKSASGGAEARYEDVEYISGLGQEGDKVFGLIEWEYKKDGNTWRYIVVTTFLGQLLVVSTEESADGSIRFWSRQRKKPALDGPVYSVAAYSEGLVYCVNKAIYWDVLDADKGLTQVGAYDLNSAATSLQPLNNKLLALTHQDSIEIIEPHEKVACHSDPRPRPATTWIETAGSPPEDPQSSIILIADRECGLAGLWIPWQVPGKACEAVFEAELPSSIRTLRRGRTRPIWEQAPSRGPRFGRLVSTLDDAEVLGMGLDGSLTSVIRLDEKTWRLLRFIQNLASTSEDLYPFTFEDASSTFDPEPRADRGLGMQVDGDILERLYAKQVLERLVGASPRYMERLKELVQEVDGAVATAAAASDDDDFPGAEQYIQLAYSIIEYFLAPVL